MTAARIGWEFFSQLLIQHVENNASPQPSAITNMKSLDGKSEVNADLRLVAEYPVRMGQTRREQIPFTGSTASWAIRSRAVNRPSPAEIPGIIRDRGNGEEALWREMLDTGFTGLNSEIALTELSRLGFAETLRLIQTGWIHERAAEAKRVMRRGYLRTDPGIESLANLITAYAIVLFQELAKAGKGWRAEDRASMAAYFVGTCVRVAGKARRHWQPDYDPRHFHEELSENIAAPLDLEEIRRLVWELTDCTDDEMCNIIHMKVAKFSYDDIAKVLGTTPRAIEGKWTRFLKKLRKGGQ